MTEPETRTGRISVNLTPSVMERLDRYRFDRRWSRSTAAAVLIERGLDREEHNHDQGDDHDDKALQVVLLQGTGRDRTGRREQARPAAR
jgi:hypothetical protein